MLDSLDVALASTLYRTLELEPSIDLQSATGRVLQAAASSGITDLDEASLQSRLRTVSERFRRQGVLNPIWLNEQRLRPHFWLVNAQPGWLEHLVSQTQEQREGISQYILYGEWDSLIILRGTDPEASALRDAIEGSAYLEPVYFTATNTPLLYGYEPRAVPSPAPEATASVINALVSDYDAPALRAARDGLEDKGVFLGPTWVEADLTSNRVVAFVGVSLRGRHGVKSHQLLQALRAHEPLKKRLVHVFETERGQPFDYFAKLVCASMVELDEATNLIGYTRIGPVRLEAVTLVVARGKDQLPNFRSAATAALAATPDIRELEAIARDTLVRLGGEAVELFNGLSPTEKLVVLRSLEELDRQVGSRQWDDERDRQIRAAIAAFAAASLAPLETAGMTGAVVGIGNAVEGFLKHVLRIAVESVFGRDYARAQNELKLPTKNLSMLTLGKSLNALRTARDHPSLHYLSDIVDEEWLGHLNAFSELRNRWAHDSVPADLSRDQTVDEARRAIVEGIEIVRSLHVRILPAIRERSQTSPQPVEIKLPDKRGERGSGIFVSHSSADDSVAGRVANALLALNYPVWYAEWRIEPGDSIVERIEDGLARNDTLVILLSPSSVESAWVRRELNAALMAQLSGQDVTIVPVLIEKCNIPPTLRDIKRVDLTVDFEEGFLKLLEFLRKRRKSHTQDFPTDPLAKKSK